MCSPVRGSGAVLSRDRVSERLRPPGRLQGAAGQPLLPELRVAGRGNPPTRRAVTQLCVTGKAKASTPFSFCWAGGTSEKALRRRAVQVRRTSYGTERAFQAEDAPAEKTPPLGNALCFAVEQLQGPEKPRIWQVQVFSAGRLAQW